MKGNQRDIFNAYERLHPGSRPMLKRQYKAMPPDARRAMLDVLLELVQHEASNAATQSKTSRRMKHRLACC